MTAIEAEDRLLEQFLRWGWSEDEAEEISLPFSLRMATAACSGEKTCTSRTKRYGRRGCVFRVWFCRFVLMRIESHTLAYVKTELYRQEGFATPHEFEEYWNGLHPRKRYQPNQLVWVHFFRKLPEGLT